MKNNKVSSKDIRRTCKIVLETCQPLFLKSKVQFFSFERIYNNKLKIFLTHQEGWSQFQHNKASYDKKVNQVYHDFKENDFLLLDYMKNTGYSDYAKKNHNLHHILVMRDTRYLYDDYCYFAVNGQDDSIVNWYVNNLSWLRRFSLYFIDRAKPFFKSNMPNKKYDQNMIPEHQIPSDELVVKKWFPFRRDESLYLNLREIEVLMHLVLGKTSKVIAKALEISPRTVEFHLKNIREKLSCNTKSELLDIILRTSFIQDFII